jgi:AraC family transcriptional regulator
MAKKAYGELIGDVMGANPPPILKTRVLKKSAAAFMRVTSNASEQEKTAPLPFEDAYVFGLELRDASHAVWVDGRQAHAGMVKRGTGLVIDLNHRIEGIPAHAFDTLHMHIPRGALDGIVDDQERPGAKVLRAPSGVLDDATIRNIGAILLPALERPEQANRLFVDYITLALLAHLADRYGETSVASRLRRGGLAPWQERRAKELLAARLDGEITLHDLARETGLSRSHFARAFKVTTGQPPHRWLMAKRIERAQEFLGNPILPLAEIANLCGFASQSHFTRVFTKAIGRSPGDWRREQVR